MSTRWIAGVFAAGALLAPGTSLAQQVGAGDQYQEQVPEGGGPAASDTPASGSSLSGDGPTSGGVEATTDGGGATSAPAGNLSPPTVEKFNADADGAAAAELAQQTAPDSEALRDAAAQAQLGTVDGSSGGVLDSTSGTGGSDDGMGPILLVVLGATAAAGAAYWLWRRRAEPLASP